MRVVDAAKELGVAPSTAHRLMATLVYRGFALQDEQRRYCAGPSLRLDASPNPVRKLVAAVRPHLDALAAESGETVNLVERVGVNVHFLHSVEGPQLVRIGDRSGTVLAAGTSAAGLAALSALSDAAIVQLYRRRATRSYGNELDEDGLAQLLSELAQVRARKYAINIGRTEPELAAIGGYIGIFEQHRTLALSLSAPISRAQSLLSPHVVSLLNSVCGDIRDALDTQLG